MASKKENMEPLLRCEKCDTWIDPADNCNGLHQADVPDGCVVWCGPVREVVVEQGKPWRWKDEK